MPKLIFTSPGVEGQTFELPEGKTTVGRAADNMLVIEHPCVSAHHCEILCYGREVIVRDDGSSNGTRVNGYRLRGQTALQNGQTISFASIQARLELPAPAEDDSDTDRSAIYLHARASKIKPISEHRFPTVIKPASAREPR